MSTKDTGTPAHGSAVVTTRHGSAVVTTPSATEVLITRSFDAPAAAVFAAYTEPELVQRWWGFESSEWLVCDVDLRVGGRWRYVTREEDGTEVGFHGEYREIEAPHRLVTTEAYEGIPNADDAAALNIVTLDEVDGVTTLTVLVQMPSQEARDAMLASGMEGGLQVSYDRLEDLVRTAR
jgi:uncharacterized protein YndB with AHSA1/START domain